MSTNTSDIRNVVTIGHRGCGKTTLTEALLYAAGAINRLGSVDDRNTIADFEPEERERQISISPALCNCMHRKTKINIIDTAGFAEFFAESLPCFWVADAALMVVDAAAGVEVHTHKVYSSAAEMKLPIVAVINKMRGEHADYESALQSINEMLSGAEAVAVQVPVGEKSGFDGVVDLLSMRMLSGSEKGGAWGEISADLADEVAAARDALVDGVAATDDALMEKYFENETLTQDELAGGLAKAVAAGQIVPVVAVDAASTVGVGALLDFIISVCPAPDARGEWNGHVPGKPDEAVVRRCAADEPFSAVVFKTMSDPYVGRISLIRVVSGTAKADDNVMDAQSGNRERLSGLASLQGNKMQDVPSLAAGDLGCVTKLEHVLTGATLCEQKAAVIFDAPPLPQPMHTAAVEAAGHADEDKLAAGLTRLAEEDIGFQFGREPSTGEMLMRGMGALHVDVIVEKLQRKFEASVSLREPKVPYRETVRKSVRVQGRHKKQTGGRGQFGDVWIQLEPTARDEGFEFVNAIKGGSVPTNYIPAVEKGVIAQLQRGILTHSQVVDVRVTLDDGSSHAVDSSDQAFQMAGQIAIRNALAQADCLLLEPVMNVEVRCPEDLMGDIMSDFSGRRGRIQGSDSIAGGIAVVRATVPLSEMARYAADLRSITQGRASYTMEPAGYEEVPAHLVEGIVAAHQAEEEEE